MRNGLGRGFIASKKWCFGDRIRAERSPEEEIGMLVDRYDPEDVFARVPEVAQQSDLVLRRLDQVLEEDQLYRAVRADLGKRSRSTLVFPLLCPRKIRAIIKLSHGCPCSL